MIESGSRRLIGQVARFALVGGVGALIDIGGTMFLLSVGWSPVVARAPAFSTALVATWLLHGAYTFGVRDRLTTRSFRRFAVLALSIALINYLVYAGLVVRDVWPPIAIVISTGICTGISYLAYRFFAFR